MSYKVEFQTDYPDLKYGSNTVANSACGPFSLANALNNTGLYKLSALDICKFSLKVGARIPGEGTDMGKLLIHAAKEYDFMYSQTSKNDELKKHLQNGGVAIIYQGEAYPIFATGGHYVAAIDYQHDRVIVADSYYSASKYSTWPAMHSRVTKLDKGILSASISTCGLASRDTNPSYFLITPVKKPTSIKFATKVKFRSRPSSKARLIARFNSGIKAKPISETKHWYKVDSKKVWIAKNRVRTNDG